MASAQSVRTLVEAMETRDGLVVSTLNRVNRTLARSEETQAIDLKGAPAVSADGRAIGWWRFNAVADRLNARHRGASPTQRL